MFRFIINNHFFAIVAIVEIAFHSLVLNHVSAVEVQLPFDNRSLTQWTTADGKPVESGWEVIDGVVHLKKEGRRVGHILTASEFGDFSLEFEWKIAPGGNSGIKYRVQTYGKKVLGCEYQICDDDAKKKLMLMMLMMLM